MHSNAIKNTRDYVSIIMFFSNIFFFTFYFSLSLCTSFLICALNKKEKIR